MWLRPCGSKVHSKGANIRPLATDAEPLTRSDPEQKPLEDRPSARLNIDRLLHRVSH
jgi:hypothetical protein